MAPADYGDGISTPAGDDRPGPREISNAIAAQDEGAPPNDRQLSAFIYVWGQFLDHDIDLTLPPETAAESLNIAVPAGDPYFDPDNTGTQLIPFTRSVFDPETGASSDNPRQQINQITSWIDGSVVYGSDADTASLLRTHVGGRMLTGEGDLLPTDEDGKLLAGDVRADENIELTSMHALFVREHNWWADRISQRNAELGDEEIYQRARAIVGAEIQVITYNEFLPALLGKDALQPYLGYDESVNPNIANEFSTAAYRLGHSMLNDDVEFFGDDGRAVREEIELREAFNNPGLLLETGIDSILKYAASAQAAEMDNQMVDGLRNFLFGQPGQGGLDLASLNIQRGRDHGLADYNSVRQAYGLAPVTSFDEITSDAQLQQSLSDLYGDVDNVDLWVGALAETHLTGSSVGPLIQRIVSDQFERLRDGDRYWYQNVFARAKLRALEATTLADVIQRNTTVANLQENVFFMRAEVSGQVFLDANDDGDLDRRERGLAGVTIELLNDEGQVIASTLTDRNGRYRFTDFQETGDFQLPILVSAGMSLTTPGALEVLISRGDLKIKHLDFGLLSSDGYFDAHDSIFDAHGSGGHRGTSTR